MQQHFFYTPDADLSCGYNKAIPSFATISISPEEIEIYNQQLSKEQYAATCNKLHDERRKIQILINTIDAVFMRPSAGREEIIRTRLHLVESRMVLGRLLRQFSSQYSYSPAPFAPADSSEDIVTFEDGMSEGERLRTFKIHIEGVAEQMFNLVLTMPASADIREQTRNRIFAESAYSKLVDAKMWLGIAYQAVMLKKVDMIKN